VGIEYSRKPWAKTPSYFRLEQWRAEVENIVGEGFVSTAHSEIKGQFLIMGHRSLNLKYLKL